MKISGYIILTFVFQEHRKHWEAYCKELGTATFGHSFRDAKEKLEDAVLCHLNTLEEVGERTRFFREHNIHFYREKIKCRETAVKAPVDNKTYVQSHLQPVYA
mgnify:CR=1 FL=1